MRPFIAFLHLFSIMSIIALGCSEAPTRGPSPPRTLAQIVEEWREITDTDKRWHLAQEIVRNNHLIGRTREQVIVHLGEPHPRRMSPSYGDIQYIVGPSGVDDLWLCIHLEGDRVVRAELRSD